MQWKCRQIYEGQIHQHAAPRGKACKQTVTKPYPEDYAARNLKIQPRGIEWLLEETFGEENVARRKQIQSAKVENDEVKLVLKGDKYLGNQVVPEQEAIVVGRIDWIFSEEPAGDREEWKVLNIRVMLWVIGRNCIREVLIHF